MNLYDIIIDRSPAQKDILISKCCEELKPLGYSVILTTSLAKLIAEARHQGSLGYAL
jgi:hypothetical protein